MLDLASDFAFNILGALHLHTDSIKKLLYYYSLFQI